MVPLDYYVMLSAAVFVIGAIGVLAWRNLMVVLMAIVGAVVLAKREH